ncbi:hypothetical protein [Novosphingobium soli]|uniref:Iron transporter n=1 Tax=Novosphingobium soli TaxID=574956 RepID=A0ABV6CW33_9SPHN
MNHRRVQTPSSVPSRAAGRKPVARRGEVAARILAAIPANYAVTSLAAACTARLLWQGLGMDAANASVTAMLASFALFAILALVAFGTRSAFRLWAWLIGAALVMGAGLWISVATGGRL